MSFNGITNLNQYAAMQNYKTNPAKQSQSTTPTDTKANEPKNDTPKTESGNKNDAVKMDLATRKALAKGPLDEAEVQRRIADREGMRNVDINDVRKSMEASRPHAAEVEKSKESATKYGPIQAKILSGGKNDNLASSLIAAFDEAYRSYKM